ncbi:ligand-binding sensor domain-containing protein [Arsukibacterium sp.]|uniref:ligand-binding sensor domain-containing protein n=1 Tax=Arsukibacterium sp. TaxID=1977258 RepID=UPI002FD9C3B9
MKQSWGKMLLRLWLLCWVGSSVAVAEPSYDFAMKHWTSAQGLSSNSVRAISQDKLGYIWLGTLWGLNRFDGLEFEHFTTDNQRHLASNAITKLLHDSSGYLWIGTKAGLSGLDPLTLKFERFSILSEVTSIIEISPDEIWVAADHLFRIRQGRISRIEDIKTQVSQLKRVGEDIWVSSAEQLYKLDAEGTLTAYPLPSELSRTPIYDLSWSEHGLHIASESGYYHLTAAGEIKTCTLPDGDNVPVYNILVADDKHHWISAYRKLYHRQVSGDWQTITATELGSSPWFSDIFQDKDNNIWLASHSDGVYRAAKGHVRRLSPEGTDPVVRSLALTPDNKLLMATQSALGVMDQQGHYQHWLTARQLGAQTVHDMHWLDNQRLWLGLERGLVQYQLASDTLSTPFPELQGMSVRVVQPGQAGEVWLGTVRGLYVTDGQSLQLLPFNDELESRHITALQWQPQQLTFGTTRGVYQYANQRLNRLGVGTPLYNSYVLALLQLEDDTLIVSTIDDGIFIRQQQQWWQFDTSNGMPHGPAVSLSYHAQSQMLWVSTNKGVFRLALPLADNQADFVMDELLSPYDRQLGSGVSRCCNGAGHAKAVLWQDEYWFPTLRGLIALPAKLSHKSDDAPAVLLKSLMANQPYILMPQQQRIVLEQYERNISIHYSALEFARPEAIRFRYRLLGFEQEWHQTTERREAIYTNVPAGSYQFQLQAKLGNEQWAQANMAELTLVVPQRFDETLLYRMLWLLLLLCCLYGVMWLVRRNTLYKQLELERLVRQRTQELENSNIQLNDLNDKLSQLTDTDSLTGLRNRRFLFEQLPKDVEHFQRNRESLQAQGKCIVLIQLDLDNFKLVNDQFGNSAGDRVIQQISGLLIRETRGSDYVVRYAGDVFVLVLRDIQLELVQQFSYKLCEQIRNTYFNVAKGETVSVTCSVGYAIFPLELVGGQLIGWEVSLRLAELALQHIKANGKDAVATLNFALNQDAFEFEDLATLDQQVAKSLDDGIVWYYQLEEGNL